MLDLESFNGEKDMFRFEQGPIRPPSEAGSLLLRFTRNCPWNKCKFCAVYKKRKFSRRSLEEILKDIDTVRAIIDDIHSLSWSLGCGGDITQEVLNRIFTDPKYTEQYRHVALWLYNKKGTVFIQDANSLIMKTEDLVKALRYLREKVPDVKRVTSYARSSTLARKSLSELKELKDAGLDRIHVGLESGSDKVLKMVNKGVTAKKHIEGGQKVVEAGIELSEYVMPGLGGKELSKEHAIETAKVLNEINPDFIRLRTLQVIPKTPLFEDMKQGKFKPLTDDETVEEIRLFIENLEGINSTITSDHIINLLEDVQGKLPEDKPYMLKVIDSYLSLPDEEKLLFRLGRRGGALRSVIEIKNPYIKAQLQKAKRELEAQEGKSIEEIITEMATQYI